MGRKRKSDEAATPMVTSPAPTGRKESAVERRMRENRESGALAALIAPITPEEIEKAKKATTMMRVSEHFNQKVKAASKLAGVTMVNFCDDFLLELVDAVLLDLTQKSVNSLESELKNRLELLRNLKSQHGGEPA